MPRKQVLPEWLFSIDLTGDPVVLLADVAEIAITPGNPEEKAAKIGDRVDDALILKGVIGRRIERKDDQIVEQIALLMLGSAEQAGQKVLTRLQEWLADQGVSDDLLETIRNFAQEEISGDSE